MGHIGQLISSQEMKFTQGGDEDISMNSRIRRIFNFVSVVIVFIVINAHVASILIN